jgi:hypothetical protein
VFSRGRQCLLRRGRLDVRSLQRTRLPPLPLSGRAELHLRLPQPRVQLVAGRAGAVLSVGRFQVLSVGRRPHTQRRQRSRAAALPWRAMGGVTHRCASACTAAACVACVVAWASAAASSCAVAQPRRCTSCGGRHHRAAGRCCQLGGAGDAHTMLSRRTQHACMHAVSYPAALRQFRAEEPYGCGWRSWDRENMAAQGNLSQFF